MTPPRRWNISRRGALIFGAGAVVGVAGSGRTALAAAKMPKGQAGYSDKPRGGNECDKCLQFQPPSACKIVDGDISPSGWCNLFAAKPQ